MAALQEYYLTFKDVNSPLELEKFLFKLKTANSGKLTVESIPQSYPGQVWFWTNLSVTPLQFMKEKNSKLKNNEVVNA